VFIPLIVVNCLILGRAEAFASKNSVVDSAIDGVGMGLGFTMALMVIGAMRELLATGGLMYGNYLPFFVNQPITIFSIDWLFLLFDPNFVLARPVELIDGVYYYISIFRISEWTTSYSIEDFSLAMFSLPPGAFIALGVILAFIQGKKVRKAEKLAEEKKKLIAEKKRIALEKKKAAALKKAGEN
jgi:electron transport complex protein RnfE